MSKVLEIIKKRHSIRAYQNKEIPENILKDIESALILAPSAGNLQARKFYFVKDRKIKIEIARASLSQMFIAEAPVVIVGCTDSSIQHRYGERGVKLYSIQDVAISVSFAMLVAEEYGLGTVWIGAFNEKEVSQILNLSENLRPVVILPMGYPDEEPYLTDRRSKKELIEYI
ncbi:MAG: nitroreductase family protein [Proteobacteria bacterium]|nr:nitroreductase family protein [Pseudomonadota bacterium]